jgi:hypothetical protein
VKNWLYTVRERSNNQSPNAIGYFVQNTNGATVAGPYPLGPSGLRAAWAECDRLTAIDLSYKECV